jgi:hypothetical protein
VLLESPAPQSRRTDADATLVEHLKLLQSLLLVEECQMILDMESYDQYEQRIVIATSDSAHCVVKITVPGAAENRPHIRYGDVVRFRLSNTSAPLRLPLVRSAARALLPRFMALARSKCGEESSTRQGKVCVCSCPQWCKAPTG